MEGFTLKARAITFAMGAAAAAFVIVLVATAGGIPDASEIGRALILAIVCGAICWFSIERGVATTAAAIDAAIERLTEASKGDLASEIPAEIETHVPHLAATMRGLFGHLSANLESVHRIAMVDPVTALPNRTSFRRSCEHMLETMPPQQNAALLFIDLDRFKAVNDTMGHATGDMLLGMVANRLRAVGDRVAADATGPAPLIGRLAGDEFTMFFPELGDDADISRICRGVLFALAEPFHILGTDISIGASIGVALRPEHGEALTDLMRAADAAMYHAKATGRGRAEHYSETLANEIAGRLRLEGELREAIDRKQFDLVYQPQVAIRGGETVAAEALLRWHHPDGVRLPESFIRRAEETGLIVEIGDWVIGKVAATIARWGELGIEQRLAINISPRQLDRANFFHRLRAAMQEANAPARLLELEITESLAMHCSDTVIEAIALLRADGATVAIDDFGTSYSSLAKLRALPVDRIKLDQSLIAAIATDEAARNITQAVIGLIHGLGCEAVGEGIETQAQADVLRVIGCDVIQGYAVALPMDEAAFIAWSRGNTADDARRA
ncbi:putative bifunctional diguanylate cyclase/phosphodiesterase [Sphingomonas immobilis]|uniref:EAL domain-containing protein n=1 Tax=Sphingomonas immobilis TaxID=3063997 RepID=A0ABT8ZTR3_9SPHN|nr:EAL domain-containing protein [Sphingomonas sp. CA1-15]MDO7840958.1 EAL domain-containing protein [Sphingomonas sp. CA1-15]